MTIIEGGDSGSSNSGMAWPSHNGGQAAGISGSSSSGGGGGFCLGKK